MFKLMGRCGLRGTTGAFRKVSFLAMSSARRKVFLPIIAKWPGLGSAFIYMYKETTESCSQRDTLAKCSMHEQIQAL